MDIRYNDMLNEAVFSLKFFYGIDTDRCIMNKNPQHTPSLIEVFNEVMQRCRYYSPFADAPSNYGVFGESICTADSTENFLLLHALFTNCIMNSLLKAKELSCQDISNSWNGQNHNSKHYPFMPKYEAQLCNGYFYKQNSSKILKLYDLDSVEWDSNRRYLRNKCEIGSLYAQICSQYKLSFPKNETININESNSDFITHLLLNKKVHGFINLLDRYHVKEDLTISNCQMINKQITNNHFHIPNAFINSIGADATFPIKPDPVDSILFSHQFESLFHCGLYTYLLSTYFKDDFLKYIDYFIKKDTEYLRFDRDIALISYNSTCLDTVDSLCRISPPLILYPLKQLRTFKETQGRSHYPESLFPSDVVVRKIKSSTSTTLDLSYTNWLERCVQYFKILTQIYIPLLEESFFITTINTYSEMNINDIIDMLYSHIMGNQESFETDYTRLNHKAKKEVSELIKKSVFTDFKLPDNYNKILCRCISKPHCDASVYLDPNIKITELYLKSLYSSNPSTNRGGHFLCDLARNFSLTKNASDTSNCVEIYRTISASIIKDILK